MTGIELIAIERQEQIEKHGRTIESDAENNCSKQLAHAASIISYPFHYANSPEDTPVGWNEDAFMNIRSNSRLKQLIVAGAFIAAEIDRLKFMENQVKNVNYAEFSHNQPQS